MTDKRKINEKQKFEISDLPKKLLLIAFGTLIGIIGNQVFFRVNKSYEMKVELKKDLLKTQYQFLNRILLFTYRNEITNKTVTASLCQIRTFIEEGNRVIKIDTIMKWTEKFTLPSFIIQEDKRKQLLEDIDIIKRNKGEIDFEIYAKFEELLKIITENPFPRTSDINELIKSKWNDKKVQENGKKSQKNYII